MLKKKLKIKLLFTLLATLAFSSSCYAGKEERAESPTFLSKKRSRTEAAPILPNALHIQQLYGSLFESSALEPSFEYCAWCERPNRKVWKLNLSGSDSFMFDEYVVSADGVTGMEEIEMIEAIAKNPELKKFTSFEAAERTPDGQHLLLSSRFIDHPEEPTLLTEEAATRFKNDLLFFITEIHKEGFVHLDLTENILVENLEPRIIDFETAYKINHDDSESEFFVMLDYMDALVFLNTGGAIEKNDSTLPLCKSLKALGTKADTITDFIHEVRIDLSNESLKTTIRDEFKTLLADLTAL